MRKVLHLPNGRHLTAILAAAFAFALAFGAVLASAADVIRNTTRSLVYADLAAALGDARDGEMIEVTGGTHTGNFLIDHRITLRGIGMPVLDGGGAGTVMVITAAGSVIEGFVVRNSGKDSRPFSIWGDAGIAVHADSVTLEGLKITGNDWGVLFFEGHNSRLANSDISANERSGARVMGGVGHVIERNTIAGNGEGVSVDSFYPDKDYPIAAFGDPAVVKDFAEKHGKAPPSSEVVVRDNEVPGNGFYGIVVTWLSNHIRVENNHVFLTGRQRQVDDALIAAWESELGKVAGVAFSFDRDPYGSGIVLYCEASDNIVSRNRVHENLAHGIVLNLVDRNMVTENEVKSNRVGIYLISADANSVLSNRVVGNSEYGIRIGSDNVILQPAGGNMIWLNDLTTNPVNAFDSSSRQVTAADIISIIDTLPLPQAVKDQMARNPVIRDQMVGAYLANLHPATNRWDDGGMGNHHDDFDESAEGFADRNTDGISETGKPIPGGPSIDHYPLARAPVQP